MTVEEGSLVGWRRKGVKKSFKQGGNQGRSNFRRQKRDSQTTRLEENKPGLKGESSSSS